MSQSSATRGICLLASFLLAGCNEATFRSETKLLPSGEVERAFFNVTKDVPPETLTHRGWEKVTYSEPRPHENWESSIRVLPILDANEKRTFVAAWGRFADGASLPVQLAVAPGNMIPSRLVAKSSRRDLVLVTQHEWEELLQESVRLPELRKSANELARLGGGLLGEALERGLPNHDATALAKWLDTTGQEWFLATCELLYDTALKKPKRLDADFSEQFRLLAGRYGVDVQDIEGKLIIEDEFRDRMARFARQLVRKTVTRRDGKPLDGETVQAILQAASLEDSPDSEEKYSVPLRALRDAFETAFAKKFGNQTAGEAELIRLGSKIVGTNYLDLTPRPLVCRVEMPGFVLRTDGTLRTPSLVEWRFNADDAYPHGYLMRATSGARNTEALKSLDREQCLQTLAEVSDYVTIVTRHTDWLPVLTKCVAEKNWQPFERHVKAHAEDAGTVREAKDLRRLLRIP